MKRQKIEIGQCFRTRGEDYTNWYKVLGPKDKYLGLYPCEATTVYDDFETYHINKQTHVHPSNLREENKVSKSNYKGAKVAIGKLAYQACTGKEIK